jgi:UDP-N-acetylglucosamine:LPS N-acetylglucosamine transferase
MAREDDSADADDERLIWLLVDRSEQRRAVEDVADRLEAGDASVTTDVVTITDVIGSAAREAVAGGAEKLLRSLRVVWEDAEGEEDFIRAIRRARPDLLVVTAARYVRPLSLLESLTGGATTQVGVPLDFNLSPRWFDGSIEAFLVPDEADRTRLEHAGYASQRLFRAGPPLLPEFETDLDRQREREELGFGDETVILVRSESFEPNMLEKFVFQSTLVEGDVQFVFHHNGDQAAATALRRAADEHGLRAAMFGRVPDLERYVAASDVVVAHPAEPYLPEVVSMERPLFLVGSDRGVTQQVDALTRSCGAVYLPDVLRVGSELESFAAPDRLETARERAASSELDPGNRAVADALVDIWERRNAWKPDATPEPTAPDDGETTDAPTGPFETIGTGDPGTAESPRRQRGKLPPGEGESTGPRPSISKAEAKDQLAELILVERDLERRLDELEREQDRWRNRLDLARDWGEDDLAEEAEEILREYLEEAEEVEGELEDVRRQKTKLKRAAGRSSGGSEPTSTRRRDRASEQEDGTSERRADLEDRFTDMEIERDLDDLRDRIDDELGE